MRRTRRVMSGRRTTLLQVGRIGPLFALAGVAGFLLGACGGGGGGGAAQATGLTGTRTGVTATRPVPDRDAHHADCAPGGRDDRSSDDGRGAATSTSLATSASAASASGCTAAATASSTSATAAATTTATAPATATAPTRHHYGKRLVGQLAVAVDPPRSRNRRRRAARVLALATAPRGCRLVGREVRGPRETLLRRRRRRPLTGLGGNRSSPGARRRGQNAGGKRAR